MHLFIGLGVNISNAIISAIDNIPDFMNGPLRALAERTGFSITVLLGGPHPKADGALSVARYFSNSFTDELLLISNLLASTLGRPRMA